MILCQFLQTDLEKGFVSSQLPRSVPGGPLTSVFPHALCHSVTMSNQFHVLPPLELPLVWILYPNHLIGLSAFSSAYLPFVFHAWARVSPREPQPSNASTVF